MLVNISSLHLSLKVSLNSETSFDGMLSGLRGKANQLFSGVPWKSIVFTRRSNQSRPIKQIFSHQPVYPCWILYHLFLKTGVMHPVIFRHASQRRLAALYSIWLCIFRQSFLVNLRCNPWKFNKVRIYIIVKNMGLIFLNAEFGRLSL